MPTPQQALKQLALLATYGKTMRLAADSWEHPWQTLFGTLLSARTRDEVTIIIAEQLFQAYPTLQHIADAPLQDIQKIIKPINFYKNKSTYLKTCAQHLLTAHNGNIPNTVEALMELPGVGRKTANVYLSVYGKNTIGVDTHVAYLSKKLEWTTNTNPLKVEEDLKRLFPQNYWIKINQTLVRFGKTYTSRNKKDTILEAIKNKTA